MVVVAVVEGRNNMKRVVNVRGGERRARSLLYACTVQTVRRRTPLS